MVNMNQALGEDTVSQSTVSRWFRRFASGNSSFEDEERSGRPVELEDDDLLRELQARPDSTTLELAQSLGFMHTAFQSRLHALCYRRVLARWISSDNCSLFVKTICRDRADYVARHLNFLAADSR